jgi:hypothetical protein
VSTGLASRTLRSDASHGATDSPRTVGGCPLAWERRHQFVLLDTPVERVDRAIKRAAAAGPFTERRMLGHGLRERCGVAGQQALGPAFQLAHHPVVDAATE